MAKITNTGGAVKRNPLAKFTKSIGTQRLIALLALIILYLVFGFINPAFRSYATLVNIFDASYYIGLMAIGVTFAITSDGIDLSIGTVLTCSALISGQLITKYHLPVALWLLVCILIGALFGLLNGLMVSYLHLPPFIATLGSMMLSKGLGSIFTKAQSVTWPQSSQAEGWFRNIFKINQNGILIPTGFILLIVIAILASILLNKTRPGRYIVALGSNSEATRLSGVNIAKWRTLAYIISGTLAGLAGLATISGTLIGVFIMSVLKTGLPFVGLQSNWQQAVTGVVLVFAVFMDVMNRQKKKKVTQYRIGCGYGSKHAGRLRKQCFHNGSCSVHTGARGDKSRSACRACFFRSSGRYGAGFYRNYGKDLSGIQGLPASVLAGSAPGGK